jgi:phosphinothricin acetyltransferase
MSSTEVIRSGVREDLPQIVAIYNHYVTQTHITFDIDPVTVADRVGWFDDFSAHQHYQLWVAMAAGELLGYAHARAFRPKAAYATSVETTIYLKPDTGNRGLGSHLFEAMLVSLEKTDVHRAYGAIALPNEASTALHLKYGFEPLYVLSEVGRKFNRYYDVQWFEKKF